MTGRRGRFVSKNAAASGRESKYIKFISSMREQQPTLHHGSIEGVHDAIVDAGFEMVVGFASDFSDGDCQRLIGSDSGKCAGYIVWYNPLTFNNSFLEIIKTERVRVVFIDTCPSQIEASFVTTDNIDGTHQAVNHLVELGHHRITYVTPPTDRTTIRDRLTGFLRGSVENKLPLTDIDVVHVGWDFKGEAEKIAETIFSRQPRPTAIVACQDLLAIELEFALLRKGIKIPDDISLVGYDDIDKSGIMPVPLTTVKQDFYEMGRVAASILIDELEMRDGQLVHKVFLPARLIVRESVRRV
jgi:DNA-binding LacI/PurR family transcriptional regulator